MKKSYLMIIAAAAALMASCSDTDKLTKEFTNTRPTEKIGFSVYSEKATRADQTNSTNLYDFHKTFDVYSWKTVDNTSQAVFSHTPVAHFTSDTQGTYVYKDSPAKPSDEWGEYGENKIWTKGWFYENVRYWDKLATGYNFYAIAPYEPTPEPALTITNGAVNIQIGDANDTYDIEAGEKNLAATLTQDKLYYDFNKDYMLADKSETKNQLVTLNFHHILTKFNVKITLQNTYTSTQTFTINNLKIVGLENKGYFQFNTNMATNGWHTTDGETYNWEFPHDYILKNVPATAEDQTEYSGYYWLQTLIFPQTLTCKSNKAQSTSDGLTDKYLYVKYTIGSEAFEAYYDLTYVFNPDAKPVSNDVTVATTYKLEQGSEYTLNIKVGPEPISFEAQASKWADEVVSEPSVN